MFMKRFITRGSWIKQLSWGLRRDPCRKDPLVVAMLGLKPRVIVIAARSSRQWFSFEVFILKSGVCFYRVYFKSGVNIWEAEMALPYWLNNPSRVSCCSPLSVFIPLWVGWALVNRPVQSAERERERESQFWELMPILAINCVWVCVSGW
jgi:hypothetical protein